MQLTDNQGNVIDDLNPLPTKEVDSTIVKPVKIDSHTSQTIQTHNAVSVATVTTSIQASWFDCDGFTDIAATAMSDSSTGSWYLDVWWSNDGATFHGRENILNLAAGQNRAAQTQVKARYAKFQLYNGDTISHTMSAWAYLKA